MKYVILADSSNIEKFKIPRQLTKINGEKLIKRTIRLLRENGVEDIIITAHDERFDGFEAVRYEPKYNYYVASNNNGYWLNAFPLEILDEPTTYLFGDVYYSENAIKTIVETDTTSTLFFCTYKNEDKRYIKQHDEPLAYKIVDIDLFKEHIKKVKEYKDKGLCCREPIVWELYRSINGLNINVHEIKDNCCVINDESCDIDTINDIIRLENVLGGSNMVKVKVIEEFTLKDFNVIESSLIRADEQKKEKGKLYVNDIFECNEYLAKYLTGENKYNIKVVDVIEVIPEKEDKPKKEINKKKNTKSRNK